MANDKNDGMHNLVGPIFRTGELAGAAVQALEEDNPANTFHIDERAAYVRVMTERECVIRRETMEDILGRPFEMQELETVLGSFSGQIESNQDFIRFYFEKTL